MYINYSHMNCKKKIIYFFIYAVLINGITLFAAYCKGIQFDDMALSYRIKYIFFGGMLGMIMPFFGCLLEKDKHSLSAKNLYTKRLINDVRKYFSYATYSARSDLKSEVANSYLDWLWWLIEPFCTMLIYTLIFGVVFQASEPFFPIFIFIGITMWGFFARSISGSVNMVRMNREIVTKVYIPKYILLLSKMLVNGFKALVSFGIVVLMMVVFQVKLTVNILWAFPVFLILFLFTFGMGILTMHYGVYVSDLGYITGIVLNMLMYLTGTFYSVAKRIPEPFGVLLEKCNPIAFLISTMRDVLLYGKAPDFEMISVWTVISVVLIALGTLTVYKNENAYVKVL